MHQQAILTKIIDASGKKRLLQFGEPILYALGFVLDVDCEWVWFHQDEKLENTIVSVSKTHENAIRLPIGQAPTGPAKTLTQKILLENPVNMYHKVLKDSTSRTNVRTAVSLIVQDGEGRYLLTKRQSHMRTFPDAWVLPGGSADKGETWMNTGVRELREETGLQVDSSLLRPFICWDSQYPDVADQQKPELKSQHFLIYCRVQIPEMTPSLTLQPEEVSQAVWLSPSDLQKVLFLEDCPPSPRPNVYVENIPSILHRPIDPDLLYELQGIYPNSVGSGISRAHRWALNECLKADFGKPARNLCTIV